MEQKITEICIGAYMITCSSPAAVFRVPFVATTFIVKEGDTLFIIDPAAGIERREKILKKLEDLSDGLKKVIIVNTHSHVDHTANNSLILSIKGKFDTEVLASEKSKGKFSPYAFFKDMFEKIDMYYDIFEGPPPPWRFVTRVLGMGNRRRAMDWLLRKILSRYEPIEPAEGEIEFLKDEDLEEIDLGAVTVEDLGMTDNVVSISLGRMKVKGWKKGSAVLIPDGAHSPDHIMVLFPEKKLLLGGDLSVPLFPTWPWESSAEKTREFLDWVVDASSEGIVDVYADSHSGEYFRGVDSIKRFLGKVLEDQQLLSKTILSMFDEGKKLTINEIYKGLRRVRFENKIIDAFLENQFPKTPIFLKTVILGILLEEGFKVEGKGKFAKFYRG